METVLAKVTPKLVTDMDEIIQEGWYANRSELIREAIREKIKKIKSERMEAAIKEDVKWGLYGKNK
ncbi:MAG TPA: ribbon-helix-helix domain-containing protein [Candidatus Nanoarchaeia archaeon]|nr:ribbon-helix-helix domain-containing protein [Candidatus Nanoarchaeia archaeon]